MRQHIQQWCTRAKCVKHGNWKDTKISLTYSIIDCLDSRRTQICAYIGNALGVISQMNHYEGKTLPFRIYWEISSDVNAIAFVCVSLAAENETKKSFESNVNVNVIYATHVYFRSSESPTLLLKNLFESRPFQYRTDYLGPFNQLQRSDSYKESITKFTV